MRDAWSRVVLSARPAFGVVPHGVTTSWCRRLGHLAFFLGAFSVALFRTPPSSWNAVWAEDGGVFLTEASARGLSAMDDLYQGYIHAVPRLLSHLVVGVVSVDYWPVAVTVLSAACTALLALTVAKLSEAHIRSMPIRGLLVLSFVALPIAGNEVANNFANLHGYFVAAAAWALLTVAGSRRLAVLQCVIVVLAALSDPTVFVLAPIALFRALALPARRDRAVAAAYVVASALQLVAVVSTDTRTTAEDHLPLSGLLEFVVFRVGDVTVVGARSAMTVFAHGGRLAVVLVCVALALFLILGFRADKARGATLLAFSGTSVAVGLVVFYLQGPFIGMIGLHVLAIGSRYSVIAVLLLSSAVAIAADAIRAKLVGRRARTALVALVAAVAIGPMIVDYHYWNVRAGAPDWGAAVAEARAECLSEDPDTIHTLPSMPPFFQGVSVTCSTIGPFD